ncbi:fdrA domain protein [Alkaliphilus serpentinus]|uniref:FdrA domain protein n=1 Tax=Alkaliphilus serpentinus TaxID=1482731 RepID=A0A833HQQ3_9FIRM|nr:fdrA domain protein [Alkaliphilus serpentinus]KAB3532092.1 fdrA domain protein [Alkaliphilus serpentinus]
MNKINPLFKKELKVVNVGLKSFATDLKQQDIQVIHVDWRPPAGGNERMAKLLNKLK